MNTGGAGVVVLGGSESSSILVQKSGLLWSIVKYKRLSS
jgi:hypothetical protein